MTDGPAHALRALIADGTLKADPAQEAVAAKLQALHRKLRDYQPQKPEADSGGWFGRLFGAKESEPETQAPKGLYLVGGVGRGKSMLMDLFFETAPIKRKRRVHFHAFMQEVQERVHARRQAGGEGDPIPETAARIAADAQLLCFDEFQVENIADAMILSRLFEALFQQGVVVVATSNVAPNDLYKDGLQRERFLPFIGLLQAEVEVHELASPTDYRLDRLRGRSTYHTPLDEASAQALDEAFADITDGVEPHAETLKVRGRELTAPCVAKGAARFSFEELCARPLGAADYVAIAQRFHTIVLSGIPLMPPEKRNEAKRFVTLIDALYEAKVNLVCSAAALPHELNPAGETSFAFQRTISRLLEMQADDYIAQQHQP